MKTFKLCIYSLLAIASILSCGAVLEVSAATFTVTNTNNAGAGSLRQAILDANAAATADTVVFDASFNVPRTVMLATVISTSQGSTADTLSIIGPGPNLLTIDGGNITRIFTVATNDTISISGMTLTRGNGGDGGAIQSTGLLTLTDVNFTNNVSNSGGAVSNNGNGTTGGVLNINNCDFINNQTTGTNINGDGGSALESGGGIVTITDSLMTGGTTRGGGGAIRAAGILNITNTTISNNTSGGSGNGDGGGAMRVTGTTTITNSILSGNTASEGTDGGAIVNEGQLSLTSSLVTGNSAHSNGGGIDMAGTSASNFLRIVDSTISNNRANTGVNTTGVGGGVYVEGNPGVTLTRSTISGNSVPNSHPTSVNQGHGGGIYSNGQVTMENCTVSGNSAAQNFGGVRIPVTFSDSTVTNSTIVNNTAGLIGGGIGRNNCSLSCRQFSIGNNIIANNTAPSDPDIRNVSSNSASTRITSLGYNLIENVTGAFLTLTATDITGQDPSLGPLENNGGPTQTHAPLLNSPVRDKGSSFTATTDQRNFPRPFDYPGIASAPGGDGSDIGAVEMRPTAQISGRVTTPSGQGLRNATVILTDSLGNRTPAATSTFGLYTFPNVPTGLSYTITVSSKRYRFAPRSINVNGDRNDLDMPGLE